MCCRVGRSLIQFHCLSRASEINQKKKLGFAFGLISPLTRLLVFQSLAHRVAQLDAMAGAKPSRLNFFFWKEEILLLTLVEGYDNSAGDRERARERAARKTPFSFHTHCAPWLISSSINFIEFSFFFRNISRLDAYHFILIPAQHAMNGVKFFGRDIIVHSDSRSSSSFGFISFRQCLCLVCS